MDKFCVYLPIMAWISFVISFLGLFDLVKYIDSGINKVLLSVRARLDLTRRNTWTHLESILHALLVICVGFLLGYLFLEFIFFQALRWSPSSLIYNPQYGFSLLVIGFFSLLFPRIRSFILSNLSSSPKDSSQLGFFKNYFINTAIWSYIFIAIGLLAPYVAKGIWDFEMPRDFLLYFLAFPIYQYFNYVFHTFGFTVLFALVGIIWLFVVTFYYIFHGLNQFPQKVVGTIAGIFGAIAFLIPEITGYC